MKANIYPTLFVVILMSISLNGSLYAANYQPASSIDPLPPGGRIENLYPSQIDDPYILQRLTGASFWVSVQGYNALFYVGDEGVLVVDPLGHGAGEGLLAAIREVTDLPITGLVYSHYHLDHIEDAAVFASVTLAQEAPLKIYASSTTADHIRTYGDRVQQVTEVIAEPFGSFTFENTRVEMHTPAHGHSDDNSMIYLPKEGILHYVDMINPDQMPYLNFAGVQDFNAYQRNLHEALALDWQFLNAGHGNIGTKEDIYFVLNYIAELRSAINTALNDISSGPFHDPQYNHVRAYEQYSHAVIEKIKPMFVEKYGDYYAFEDGFSSHVKTVLGNIELYG